MFHVEDDPKAANDQPMETIHVYVVREGQTRPSLTPVIISVLALFILIASGILTSYQQPEQRAFIRVPAVLLPLKTFTTSVSVIPTGSKTYPATTAHGLLTITNGSILAEELPQGMIFTGKDGVEVITDAAVNVPAGSATDYGIAHVSAHAVIPGAAENISALDINVVEGTSLYIRNVQPFKGGENSSTVIVITHQDRKTAITQARATLLPQTLNGLLQAPCKEIITGNQIMKVAWTCQFVSYNTPHLPGVKVLHAEVRGTIILLDIVYVARPRILTAK